MDECRPVSVAYHGNVVDLLEYAVQKQLHIDLLSDQTSCHATYEEMCIRDRYEAWKKVGNRLLLSGTSIGNHQNISFTDTLTIEKLTQDSPVSYTHLQCSGGKRGCY